jgi:hypothetical protein
LDYSEVLRKLNRRGILQLGWSEKKEQVAQALAEHQHVRLLSDVPHDWLFPRCSVVRGAATSRGNAGDPLWLITQCVIRSL